MDEGIQSEMNARRSQRAKGMKLSSIPIRFVGLGYDLLVTHVYPLLIPGALQGSANVSREGSLVDEKLGRDSHTREGGCRRGSMAGMG
jgi:hypothetical protein